MKKLKKSYHKAFFTLIKAYKRYYLGAWLFKIPFYKLTSNAVKLQKWQEKRNQRREFLQEALKKFKDSQVLCKEFNKQSELWLNSKEFKERYLDTKHPYPPLLNPALLNDESQPLNYKQIPAEMAWELNLPLPQNYDFLYIANVCNASLASTMYLRELGCVCIMSAEFSFKELYIYIYYNKNHQAKYIFLYFQMLTIWDKDNSLKFKKMLTKKVPLLFVVRDPISHIRGEINHPSNRYVSNIVRNFNLTYKNTINQLIPKAEYRWGLDYKPSFNFLLNNASEFLLDNTDSFISLTSLLAKDTLLDTFKDNISFVYCVEFNDMKADKAFDTFCEIAKKFNLKQPKNKEFFADKQWTEIYTLLPATLYIHPDDLKKNERNLDSITNKDSIQIIITLPSHLSEEQKRFVNIGLILEDNLIIDETRVLIIIKEEDLNKLKENSELYKATIKFLKDYINAIRNEVDRRKEDKITEKQILEFLCQNDKIRKNIKQILDNELNYIKANHPSFIQKWKYYLEFEKMCQELDND